MSDSSPSTQPRLRPWSAPTTSTPCEWDVEVAGSKSETIRALYLAALAHSPTRIYGALDARDTQLMATALRTFGADITQTHHTLHVRPIASLPTLLPAYSPTPSTDSPSANAPGTANTKTPPQVPSATSERHIHAGQAGTIMRFLPLLAALTPGTTHFDADPEGHRRPLGPVLHLARQLGALVTCHQREGHLPLSITGISPTHPTPTHLVIDATQSSQFLSSALLIAPLLGLRDGKARHISAIEPPVSQPHIDMTLQALRTRGITCTPTTQNSWIIHPGLPTGGTHTIAPDLSNAGIFLAAALLTGGRVKVARWPQHTTQAGDVWRQIFTELGAHVYREADALVVDARSHANAAQTNPSYPGKNWDFSAISELTPTAVALLLFADSPSSITGISHIRGHESDRIHALAQQLHALGSTVEELPDGLRFTPLIAGHSAQPKLMLHSYADHRMAGFAALVGLRVPGISVDDVECMSKTLPGFDRMWTTLVTNT